MKKLVFTVTNDLNYDQRMIRICNSLQMAGYDVLLVGRRLRKSGKLIQRNFAQKRLSCFFEKGSLFYIEYNIRLFFYLLFKEFDLICAIDLDTILPCYFNSILKNKKRVYDAHELFCEMKEVVSRRYIFKIWKFIERKTVPKFKYGYTVNEPIREIFKTDYRSDFKVIMNAPVLKPLEKSIRKEPFLIYQGAVNHGRSFETLIPAFQWINYEMWIFGEGNYFEEAKLLAKQYNVEDKVIFKGKVVPDVLRTITPKAQLGITLFENNGLSNYYSLANRFFDYIHAGIPQLCVNYPVYKNINEQYEVAILIEDLSPLTIATTINTAIDNKNLLEKLQINCLEAREEYNWQNEEKKLIAYYHQIFSE